MSWRLLEAEIEAILRLAGFRLDVNAGADKIILWDDEQPELNITEFAKELSERVTLKAKAVQAKVKS